MPLGGLQDGGWPPARPSHDQKLGTFRPTFHPPEREGLENELIIYHGYVMNPP